MDAEDDSLEPDGDEPLEWRRRPPPAPAIPTSALELLLLLPPLIGRRPLNRVVTAFLEPSC